MVRGCVDVALDLDGAPDQPVTRDLARRVAGKHNGRPIELTEEIAAKILEKIATGSFLTVAAAAAGVSSASVQEWVKRGVADESYGLDTIFVRFAGAYARAKHQAEVDAVAALQRGGDGKFKDWRAQAWWLERRHKERWSLPKEGTTTGITLQLSPEQTQALVEALRIAAAKPIEVEAEQPQPVGDEKSSV